MKNEIYLDDIIYELNADKSSYAVKEYVGVSSIADIKEEVNGLKVTKILNAAFKNANTLTNISIPDTIIEIEPQHIENDLIYNIYDNGLYLGNENNPYVAFVKQRTSSCYTLKLHKDCKVLFEDEENTLDLKELYIPKEITNLNPFGLCGYVEHVVVDPNNEVYKVEGNSIIRKEDNTLIKGFENAYIPYGVKVIGEGAFCNTNLKAIEIPDSVQRIERVAFASSKLRKITIPKSVKEIKQYAFEECFVLDNVIIDSEHTIIEYCAFYRCPLNNLVIDNATTFIEKYAFDEYIVDKYKLVEAPEVEKEDVATGILYQNYYLFDNNESFEVKDAISLKLSAISLKSLSLNPELVKLSLDLCNPLFDTLTIPDGVKYLDLNISNGNIKKIIIPNSVQYIYDISIRSKSIKYNTYSKGLYLGNKENPYLVFFGEDYDSNDEFKFHPNTKFIVKGINRVDVRIPEGVIEIGSDSFRECNKIRSIRIPNSVRFIEAYSFSECINLKSVSLPASLETLKAGVFKGCPCLELIYGGAIKTISKHSIPNKKIELRYRKSVPFINDWCIDSEYGYYSGLENEAFPNISGSLKNLNEYLKGINDRYLIEKIISSHRNGNDTIIKDLVDEIFDLHEVFRFKTDDEFVSIIDNIIFES